MRKSLKSTMSVVLGIGMALGMLVLPVSVAAGTVVAAPPSPAAAYGQAFMEKGEQFLKNARYLFFAPGMTDAVFAQANVGAATELAAMAADMHAFLDQMSTSGLSVSMKDRLDNLRALAADMQNAAEEALELRASIWGSLTGAAPRTDLLACASAGFANVRDPAAVEDGCLGFVKKFKVDMAAAMGM